MLFTCTLLSTGILSMGQQVADELVEPGRRGNPDRAGTEVWGFVLLSVTIASHPSLKEPSLTFVAFLRLANKTPPC